MSKMLKSSGAMAAATMTSRILGMVREMVYSWFMGAGWVMGAFTLAFMIPNLFRRLLGEGALTAAFIPIFKEKERIGSEEEMWRAANAVISGLVVSAAIITAVAMVVLSLILATGPFVAKTDLMLRLLRVMFPYMLLICLTAVFMGMLNARGHFFIPATGALIMNTVMIGSVFFIAPRLGTKLDMKIYALAYGVLVAGAAQAAFQLPSLWAEGFRYRWVTPWNDPTVKRVVQQMVPGMIGVAAFQLNVVMTQGVAYWVDPTINALFSYGIRLMELPQGVFGISLATYLLPTLSGLAAEKNYKGFRATLSQGVDHLVFVNLLAAMMLFVLASPIMRLLFERGAFKPEDTPQAAFGLMCLAPGLLAFSLSNIFARAFYALGDTKTPMKISIFCMGINMIFAVALVWRFRQGGLGIANSVSAAFNAGILFYALRRKLGTLDFESLQRILFQILGAGLVAGVAAWGLSQWWEQRFMAGHANVWLKIGAVFVPMTAAGLLYWAITLWFKVPPATEIGGLVFARLGRKRLPQAGAPVDTGERRQV